MIKFGGTLLMGMYGMEREITGIGWMDKVINWVFNQPGWLSALILTAVVVLLAAIAGRLIGNFYMSVRYPDPEQNQYLSPVQRIAVLVAGVVIVGILMSAFLAGDDDDALLVGGDGFDPGFGMEGGNVGDDFNAGFEGGDSGDGFMAFDPDLYDEEGNYIGPDLYDEDGNYTGPDMGEDDALGETEGEDGDETATPMASGGTSGSTVRSSGGTVRSSGGGIVVIGGGGGGTAVVVERVG